MVAVKANWRKQLQFLRRIESAAGVEVLGIVRYAQTLDPVEGRRFLEGALVDLVNRYGALSGQVSAVWVAQLAQGQLDGVVVADLPPVEQLGVEARWALSGSGDDGGGGFVEQVVSDRLKLLVTKHIFGMHRGTAVVNAGRANVRFARMAREDACAFCRLLASRGAVYRSKAQAMFVGVAGERKHYSDGRDRGTRVKFGRVRGTQKMGDRYHDHCRCLVVPEFKGVDLEFPDYQKRFEQQYFDALAVLEKKGESSGDITSVLREMRAAGHGA